MTTLQPVMTLFVWATLSGLGAFIGFTVSHVVQAYQEIEGLQASVAQLQDDLDFVCQVATLPEAGPSPDLENVPPNSSPFSQPTILQATSPPLTLEEAMLQVSPGLKGDAPQIQPAFEQNAWENTLRQRLVLDELTEEWKTICNPAERSIQAIQQ